MRLRGSTLRIGSIFTRTEISYAKVLAQTEAGAFAELDAVGGGGWHKCVHWKVRTDSGGVTSRLGFRPDKGGRWVRSSTVSSGQRTGYTLSSAFAMLPKARSRSLLEVAIFMRMWPSPPVPKEDPGFRATLAFSANHR